MMGERSMFPSSNFISTVSQMIWPPKLVVLDRQGLAIISSQSLNHLPWSVEVISLPPLILVADAYHRCAKKLCDGLTPINQRLRFICINEWKSVAFARAFSQMLFEERFECQNVRTKKHRSFVVFVVVCRLLKVLKPCGFCDQIQDADSTDECMVLNDLSSISAFWHVPSQPTSRHHCLDMSCNTVVEHVPLSREHFLKQVSMRGWCGSCPSSVHTGVSESVECFFQ